MTRLAHVNIRVADLERSVAFYRDVLGLAPGAAATRPGSPDHVWMSDDNGNPCIHLQRSNLKGRTSGSDLGVHHVALACSSPEAWRQKLGAMAIDFEEFEFPTARMVQFNLRDPEGIRLELTFLTEQ